MQEQIINISFPVKEGILTSLKETKDEFTKEVLFLSALLFYRKRKLSLGKAADLAGYSKSEFIIKLQEEGKEREKGSVPFAKKTLVNH